MTVTKDSCLAVGFFQRGYVYMQLRRYEEALHDYSTALTRLRNNSFINYKQLGLRFLLWTWEVLYNMAAVQCQLGQWQEAQITLEEAKQHCPDGESTALDTAVEQVQVRQAPNGCHGGGGGGGGGGAEAWLQQESSWLIIEVEEGEQGTRTGKHGAGGSENASGDRPILYRMVAQHPYSAKGPEDLHFAEGDVLDILSEVNEEWLEGRCKGTVGIFPKCFAAQADVGVPLK
uniref:SH3 domain-containing protein n=1 Tax=Sphenodon punctatus TaxID=8508 RepID=A0A8D0GNE5_SPHPU